jgi:hypothetical protein
MTHLAGDEQSHCKRLLHADMHSTAVLLLLHILSLQQLTPVTIMKNKLIN